MPLHCTMVDAGRQIGGYPIRQYNPGFDAKGLTRGRHVFGCSKRQGARAAWLSAWSILHRHCIIGSLPKSLAER
jgi:hypothetical protein